MSGRLWTRLALINLAVLALMGCLLRYKIAFSLPFPDQKHLLHSHSHFAFTGWVTMALMILLLRVVSRWSAKDLFPAYSQILFLNYFSAWGMLVAFLIQGYGAVSISFSTLSIVTGSWFAVKLWKDMRGKGKQAPRRLFKAALFFMLFSALGTFALAYMMVTKTIHQNWYLAAIYFFLHFQYNGWFILTCLGLGFDYLLGKGMAEHRLNIIAHVFILACLPGYFLSTLWMELPPVLYALVVLSALAQWGAWCWLLLSFRSQYPMLIGGVKPVVRLLVSLSSVALTIKLLLQVGSTFPALGNLAFGFRPIVIGYLHLVLLGVVTLYTLAYLVHNDLAKNSMTLRRGVRVFIAGIAANELLLMVQGVCAMTYTIVPFINELLFVAALTMLSGMFLIVIGNSARDTVL